MKVKTIENMAVIEFGVTVEEFKKVERYAPNTLVLQDEYENETFRVALDQRAWKGNLGVIGDIGAEFAKVGNKALIWMPIPEDHINSKEDKEAYITDVFGVALDRLKSVETQVMDAISDTNARIDNVRHNINHCE